MAELKVDDEKSGAERSGRVKETRIHTTGQWRDHIQAGPQSLVQIKTEFSMYVCMYVCMSRTLVNVSFSHRGSLVMLLYSCLAITFLTLNSGAVNIVV